MNRKFLLGSAIAAALLFGANVASACAISAWSSATGITAADTGQPDAGFKRYSGKCGLRVSNATTPRFMEDITPSNEKAFQVRFYYFTGNTSGAADIFQARNTGGTNIIRVQHDGTSLIFNVNGNGTAQTTAVNDNAYYSIELAWTAATVAAPATGTMTGRVRGAGSLVPFNINFTGLSNSADGIDTARIGLIAGTPTVTAPVFFDEYDSRRTTAPGRLCRGDANGDGNLNVFDIGAMVPEIQAPLNPAVVTSGQPDANEDGTINVFDIGVMVPLITANTPCAAT